MQKSLLTFANTHFAIKAETVLDAAGIVVAPMPLPVKLGGNLCGICLRISAAETVAAVERLEAAAAPPADVYQIVETAGGKEYVPWSS